MCHEKVQFGGSQQLDTKIATLFHYIIAKLFWVTKQCHPVINTIFVLEEVGQIHRISQKKYILNFNMKVRCLGEVNWFVDGTFATHDNMDFGWFITQAKICITSSIPVNMADTIWILYLRRAWGCPMKPISMMPLERNGQGQNGIFCYYRQNYCATNEMVSDFLMNPLTFIKLYQY